MQPCWRGGGSLEYPSKPPEPSMVPAGARLQGVGPPPRCSAQTSASDPRFLFPTRDNFGFITYRYTCDAFAALENGHTLRRSNEPQFELCFGGQKQFCKSHYTDLGKRAPPAAGSAISPPRSGGALARKKRGNNQSARRRRRERKGKEKRPEWGFQIKRGAGDSRSSRRVRRPFKGRPVVRTQIDSPSC